MDAKEARKLSESMNNETNIKMREEVISAIDKACKKGEFLAYYYGNLNKTVIDFFIKEGYLIKYQNDGRNGEDYVIEW